MAPRDADLDGPQTRIDDNATTPNALTDTSPESDEEVENISAVDEGDREVLEEAEEQEKLLHKPERFAAARGIFRVRGGLQNSHRSSRGALKIRSRKSKRRSQSISDVMFEMEQGFKDTSSQSSTDSFEMVDTQWDKSASRRKSHRGRLCLIFLAIAALFVALVFGAYKASTKRPLSPTIHRPTRSSNGTHTFRPTTILISLDGFRADFLNRGLTPTLNAFIASGVSPTYMLPSFPSVTFPNHFTLVTGLYPESHGIVSNQFWDPSYQEEFYYTNLGVSMQSKWWNAEPLWVTAEHQRVRTAIHMWPGSEAHIPDVEPTYMDRFNGTEALPRKVDKILGWLDLPGDDDEAPTDAARRPQAILAYIPNVDSDGHKYGPNSTEIRATIAEVDSMLTVLVEGLLARNLTEIVNLVIVSDHGMATTSTSRLVQLDDLIDMSLVDHIDGWPLRGLRLKNPNRDVHILYDLLSQEARKTDGFDVYTRETMPARYHFSNNDRIAPLWVVPKTGWAVVERTDFDVAEALARGREYTPKGLHGYDHEHPLMRAIFVARGPAFPHAPNSKVPVFQNIEVYNIICDSLGIAPVANNGTLRLPLKIEGLHSDPGATKLDTPVDPVDGEHPGSTENQDGGVGGGPGSTEDQDTTVGGGPGSKPADDATGGGSQKTSDTSKGGWWDYLHEQLEKAKAWAKQFVESIRGNKKDGNNSTVSLG